MSHAGDPPPDPPVRRELEGESGVEPSEDWAEALDTREVTGAGARSADFDEIVERYARRLFQLAFRLTVDHTEAEDLSQEALVRGYLELEQFRGESDLYTYLYRTLLNLWKNQLRRRRRWRMISLDAASRGAASRMGGGTERSPGLDLPDRAPGPHERLVGHEQAEKLHRALLDLEPDFRAVLVLRVAEGLDYEAIAEALGIPVGTVRSRLARARGRIRE